MTLPVLTAPVVVTRHPALVALLRERGLVGPDADVREHVTPADVEGRHVIGVLPLSLAVHAASVTEIPLALLPGDRGIELSLDRLREIAGPAMTYMVTSHETPQAAAAWRWTLAHSRLSKPEREKLLQA